MRVLREQGVEHRIGDLVGDLVGVAFGDRLGREEMAMEHGMRSWGSADRGEKLERPARVAPAITILAP